MSTESRAKKEHFPEPSSLITSLPEELVVDIIARVPRCYYPTISLVCRRFLSIVASPELYVRRSLLGCTEQCLYVALYNIETYQNRWYILHRKADSYYRLVLIPSLPIMPSDASFVSVGSKIYVLGGNYDDVVISSASSIDCGSHTVHPLPSLPLPMNYTAADFIDGKIYVIGQIKSDAHRVMVLDTETQTWETEMTNPDMDLKSMHPTSAVMADKMYMRDSNNSFTYMPKESKWEMDKQVNREKWMSGCVFDDVLYYYDCSFNMLKAYDPKQGFWTVVNGVDKLTPEPDFYLPRLSQTVSYGGKLFVFIHLADGSRRNREIWCAEIVIERRRSWHIWGRLKRCSIVIEGTYILLKSLAVTV